MRPRDYDAPKQMALIRAPSPPTRRRTSSICSSKIAKRAGLDPFRKQLYCLVYNKDDPTSARCRSSPASTASAPWPQRNGDYRPDDEEPSSRRPTTAKDPRPIRTAS
jgi:hypothetical protein